jgi:hypothetical protein
VKGWGWGWGVGWSGTTVVPVPDICELRVIKITSKISNLILDAVYTRVSTATGDSVPAGSQKLVTFWRSLIVEVISAVAVMMTNTTWM